MFRSALRSIVLPTVLLACLTSMAAAAEFRAGEEVIVREGEVVTGDLYATGTRVEVRGRVEGDLVAGAQEVIVLGSVGGDVIAAGGTIEILGVVEDDIRMAGAALTLGDDARVAGDVIASGYGLELRPGATVEGDLVFGGRQALVAGTVEGSARLGVEGLELSGTVAGDAEIATSGPGPALPAAAQFGLPPVPAVASGLDLAPTARIGGDLRLELPEGAAAPDAEGVVAGRLEIERQPRAVARPWWLGWLERALVLVLVGAALLALLPGRTARAVERLQTTPAASAGWGALLLFGVPALAALAVGVTGLVAFLLGRIALGGLGAGLVVAVALVAVVALTLLGLLVAFVAPPVAALAAGRWGLSLARSRGGTLAALVGGVLALTLLARLPFVGVLVGLAIAIFGLGALWPRRPREEPEAGAAPVGPQPSPG